MNASNRLSRTVATLARPSLRPAAAAPDVAQPVRCSIRSASRVAA